MVSTKIGGTSEVISNNYNGILIDKKNNLKFSNALFDLLKNEKKRKILGYRGYKTFVNNFSVNKMVSEYHKELSQI